MMRNKIYVALIIALVILFLSQIFKRDKEIKSIVLLATRIFPKGEPEWTDKGFTDAFNKAREGGINIAIWGLQWGKVEPYLGKYDWNFINYRILKTKQQGFKLALIIEIIRTNKLGMLPKDLPFKGFNDSLIVNAFKKFIRSLLTRYRGMIHYIFIGNEVNCYFHKYPNQIKYFKNFCQEVIDEIKSIDNGIKVGVVSAYHIAKNYNELDLLKEISEIGDIVGLTIYMEEDYTYPNVNDTEKYFSEILNYLSKNKKIAVTETGWSSNGPRGSIEKQIEYIKRLSKIAKNNKNRFEFVSWVLIYDISKNLNIKIAESFGINTETVYGKNFLNWQGSLGLIKNNGIEKPAWTIWKKYMLKN